MKKYLWQIVLLFFGLALGTSTALCIARIKLPAVEHPLPPAGFWALLLIFIVCNAGIVFNAYFRKSPKSEFVFYFCGQLVSFTMTVWTHPAVMAFSYRLGVSVAYLFSLIIGLVLGGSYFWFNKSEDKVFAMKNPL
jgi:hypothetical protein